MATQPISLVAEIAGNTYRETDKEATQKRAMFTNTVRTPENARSGTDGFGNNLCRAQRVGCARVSAQGQSLGQQLDALTTAGCLITFGEKVSKTVSQEAGSAGSPGNP